jgi:hypothetical protein
MHKCYVPELDPELVSKKEILEEFSNLVGTVEKLTKVLQNFEERLAVLESYSEESSNVMPMTRLLVTDNEGTRELRKLYDDLQARGMVGTKALDKSEDL